MPPFAPARKEEEEISFEWTVFRGPLARPNAIQRHFIARKSQLATIMHIATNVEISSWMTNKRYWIIRILFTDFVFGIVSTHKYKKSGPDPFLRGLPGNSRALFICDSTYCQMFANIAVDASFIIYSSQKIKPD